MLLVNILRHIKLHSQPPPSRSVDTFSQNRIPSVRILDTLRLKDFPLTEMPDSISSEFSATYESTVAFTLCTCVIILCTFLSCPLQNNIVK